MHDADKYYHLQLDGRKLLKSSSLSGVSAMEFSSQQYKSGELVIVERVMYIDRDEAV